MHNEHTYVYRYTYTLWINEIFTSKLLPIHIVPNNNRWNNNNIIPTEFI